MGIPRYGRGAMRRADRLARFLDPSLVKLKVCGITREDNAMGLVGLGVDALGFNFWPGSKRYLDPAGALWLGGLGDRVLRVGVFVNAPAGLPVRLVADGLLDAVQLHGDERAEDLVALRGAGIPVIRSAAASSMASLEEVLVVRPDALLLDAHAPGVYGGTGKVIDWQLAAAFRGRHPGVPLILAGGITPENAAEAARSVRPVALDVASGVEASPGVKDLGKVAAVLAALREVNG